MKLSPSSFVYSLRVHERVDWHVFSQVSHPLNHTRPERAACSYWMTKAAQTVNGKRVGGASSRGSLTDVFWLLLVLFIFQWLINYCVMKDICLMSRRPMRLSYLLGGCDWFSEKPMGSLISWQPVFWLTFGLRCVRKLQPFLKKSSGKLDKIC